MSVKLALNYTIIALLATLVNLSAQEFSIQLYQGRYAITLSILIGTGAGLICKYLGDKRYIFQFSAKNLRQDGQVFVLYSLMGVFTTLIFWGFEFGFHYLFASKAMRYTGAVIGLAIGYCLKYQLDKRFVFKTMEL